MPLTKRELRVAGMHLLAAAALGLLLGFAGPFGSQSAFDRPVRYAFWLGLTLFGYTCVIASAAALGGFGERTRRPAALLLILTALLSAIPQTLATAWAFSLVQPGRTFGAAELPMLYAAVTVVQLAIVLVADGVTKRTRPVSSTPQRQTADPQFLQRLPAQLGRELIALEAQDHYLKVHTDRGAHMLLMRLSDAAAQLADEDGLQVHRGWWVAADAVARTETRSGRTVLHLTNGLMVPVSRTYLQAVRARGWGAGG